MKKLTIVLAIIGLFSSCSNVVIQDKNRDVKKEVSTVLEVGNIEYKLTSIYEEEGITLGFDNEGRIFGYTGLNRYFGKATIKNGILEIDMLATTKMGGNREKQIIEAQYLGILKSMNRIEKTKDTLILSNEKLEKIVFEKVREL